MFFFLFCLGVSLGLAFLFPFNMAWVTLGFGVGLLCGLGGLLLGWVGGIRFAVGKNQLELTQGKRNLRGGRGNPSMKR